MEGKYAVKLSDMANVVWLHLIDEGCYASFHRSRGSIWVGRHLYICQSVWSGLAGWNVCLITHNINQSSNTTLLKEKLEFWDEKKDIN